MERIFCISNVKIHFVFCRLIRVLWSCYYCYYFNYPNDFSAFETYTIEKFKSNAGYTTSNEGITKKIQFERSKDTTKITTGNNGTFPKKWCKSFSRVFTYFCTNASINSHLSCYSENRRYPRPYVFMV